MLDREFFNCLYSILLIRLDPWGGDQEEAVNFVAEAVTSHLDDLLYIPATEVFKIYLTDDEERELRQLGFRLRRPIEVTVGTPGLFPIPIEEMSLN